MSTMEEVCKRLDASVDDLDDKTAEVLFVLPPNLLQKLGFELENLQHKKQDSDPHCIAIESTDQHNPDKQKSKTILTTNVKNYMHSKNDTKSNTGTESSILETANLMKNSVLLSPTFNATTNSGVIEKDNLEIFIRDSAVETTSKTGVIITPTNLQTLNIDHSEKKYPSKEHQIDKTLVIEIPRNFINKELSNNTSYSETDIVIETNYSTDVMNTSTATSHSIISNLRINDIVNLNPLENDKEKINIEEIIKPTYLHHKLYEDKTISFSNPSSLPSTTLDPSIPIVSKVNIKKRSNGLKGLNVVNDDRNMLITVEQPTKRKDPNYSNIIDEENHITECRSLPNINNIFEVLQCSKKKIHNDKIEKFNDNDNNNLLHKSNGAVDNEFHEMPFQDKLFFIEPIVSKEIIDNSFNTNYLTSDGNNACSNREQTTKKLKLTADNNIKDMNFDNKSKNIGNIEVQEKTHLNNFINADRDNLMRDNYSYEENIENQSQNDKIIQNNFLKECDKSGNNSAIGLNVYSTISYSSANKEVITDSSVQHFQKVKQSCLHLPITYTNKRIKKFDIKNNEVKKVKTYTKRTNIPGKNINLHDLAILPSKYTVPKSKLCMKGVQKPGEFSSENQRSVLNNLVGNKNKEVENSLLNIIPELQLSTHNTNIEINLPIAVTILPEIQYFCICHDFGQLSSYNSSDCISNYQHIHFENNTPLDCTLEDLFLSKYGNTMYDQGVNMQPENVPHDQIDQPVESFEISGLCICWKSLYAISNNCKGDKPITISKDIEPVSSFVENNNSTECFEMKSESSHAAHKQSVDHLPIIRRGREKDDFGKKKSKIEVRSEHLDDPCFHVNKSTTIPTKDNGRFCMSNCIQI